MTEADQQNGGRRASTFGQIFNFAQYLYSGIPYKHFKSGYGLPPWHIILEPTRACNLRCKMCMYIDFLENTPIKRQREGELSTEEWHRVIDDIGRFRLVTFTGGELYLRPDFPELLDHASRRCFTHMITNLTLFNEDKADHLTRLAPRRVGGLGLNFLGTSVEGPEEIHDQIRRRKGSFKSTIESVRMLRDRRDSLGKGCPKIHITTVMQHENVHVLREMPRIAHEAGADVINFVTESRLHDLHDIGDRDPRSFVHDDVPWARIEQNDLRQALLDSRRVADDLGIQLRLPRMPFDDLIDFYEGKELDLNNYECRGAWNLLGVGAYGDVGTCGHATLGNVREDRLAKLWNNDVQRNFRKLCQKQVFAPCPGCCLLHHKAEREMATTMPAEQDGGLYVTPAEQHV